MFLENNFKNIVKRGWIELISGSMFSGKTEELIRRLRRAEIAGQKIAIFKPEIDKRYSEKNIVSHDSKTIPSMPLSDAKNILNHVKDIEVVGIDEAQFFDNEIVDVCNTLANNGVRVIIAGLDMDFNGNPFGSMPALFAISEYVTKVHAICMKCGNLAHYSHRLTATKKLVELGEKDIYEPLCRSCYNEIKANESSEPELFK
ncbi:MAG: thymidine kinase [Bacteroidales bacterium]|nr:thymidine kinase [Bacteroidales bacterium]MBN2758821.1 thymidine kinase [Bacteroidales bacterium]